MNVRAAAGECVRSLLDFLYPRRCLLCGKRDKVGEDMVCGWCRPVLYDHARKTWSIRRDIPGIERTCVLFGYDEHCRSLVHGLKYHGLPAIGTLFGDLMGGIPDIVEQHRNSAGTIIVPMPLHAQRLAERGYNQSEYIARGLAARTGLPVRKDVVTRTRNTPTQTALEAEQRRANVRDAFACKDTGALDGIPVLLVDDVLTTGSTLSACAQVIRDAGAKDVAAVVAATPGMGDR